MLPRVKVCGITHCADALLAASLGAHELGFNFYPHSKRYIDPNLAATIIAQLPSSITPVGVFVDEDLPKIFKIIAMTGIAKVQLHGHEPFAFCQQFTLPVIKAVHLRTAEDLLSVNHFAAVGDVLVDYPDFDNYGGTGKSIDLALARQAQAQNPIYLAGGVSTANIATMVATVRPAAVDLCSSIESHPGKKCPTKMKLLFQTLAQVLR